MMSTEQQNVKKLCRLCAGTIASEEQNNSLNKLFDKSNAILVQQINTLTGLNLRDMPRQNLPRLMCSKCGDDLRHAWEFRSKIIRTQKYFKTADYKRQLGLEGDEQKPEFAFITLNEYEQCNEQLETKCYYDDDYASEVETMVAAKVVETIIKQETNDIESGNERSKKTRTRKKVKAKQSSLEAQLTDNSSNASFGGIKEDCVDNSFGEDLANSEDPDFTMNSDDTSTDNDENSVDDVVEDPDFFAQLPNVKPKKDDVNEINTNDEPDILKDRQFHCHLCKCPLESLKQVKIHFQKQHKKEKIKCDLCDEKLPTIKSLVRHFRMHNGEKEHKCHFCDLTFKYSTIRCRHERRVHSKDAPFLCFICGKTFITTTMGKDHMTVHTKERAHHCTVCKADFLRKTHLNTHYRSMTHKNNLQKMNDELPSVNSQQNANVSVQFVANN